MAKRKAQTGKGKQSSTSSYLGSRKSGKPSAHSAGKPSTGKGKSSKHAKTCNSLEEGAAEDQWPGEAPAEQGNLVQSVFTLTGQEDDVVAMDDAGFRDTPSSGDILTTDAIPNTNVEGPSLLRSPPPRYLW